MKRDELESSELQDTPWPPMVMEFDSELDDSLIDLDDEYDDFDEEDRHKPGHTPYEE